MTDHDKRDELRAKIEASERRIAERTLADSAKEALADATEFTKRNPMTVLGGAIAVGLLIGLATPPGRRAAVGAATKVGGAASGAANIVGTAAKKRGSAFGTLVADAVVAYGIKLIDQALDTAQAGQDKFEDISDSATAKAREVRRDAEYYAGSAVDKTKSVGRRTRRKAVRAVRDIKDRVSN